MDSYMDPNSVSLFGSNQPNPANEMYEYILIEKKKEMNYLFGYQPCSLRGFREPHDLLCAKLYSLQQAGTLCDITLIVGGQTFRAHKVILAAVSEYFESMLASGFKESNQSEISIDGNGYAFGKLLEFAYTGQVKLSKEIVIEVLKLACYMQFTTAKDICCGYLVDLFDREVSLIKIEDVFRLVRFAEPHGDDLKELYNHAVSKLTLGFVSFMHTSTCSEEGSVEFLEEFMENPDFAKNYQEREILSGVIEWLKHDWANRKQHAAKFLKKIRLGLIPLEDMNVIIDDVKKHKMTECKQILDHIIELHYIHLWPFDNLPVSYAQQMFTPRSMITAPFALGGNQVNLIQYLDSCNKWKLHTHIPQPMGGPYRSAQLTGHAAVVVNGALFVAGGIRVGARPHAREHGHRRPNWPTPDLLSEFYRYDHDSEENCWTKLADMSVECANLALVHIDGKIYAVGGCSHGRFLHLVRCYSIADDEWMSVASMCASYQNPSAVAVDGKILVYGQEVTDDDKPVKWYGLEMYDPATDVWQKLASEKYQPDVDVTPMLTVEDGKCYRISYNIIDNIYKRCVNQIHLMESRDGCMSAVIGQSEDQIAFEYKPAFCMDGKVFVFLSSKYVYNTGIATDVAAANPELLDDRRWNGTFLDSGESVVSFTFEKDSSAVFEYTLSESES